jgi:hypothetical protein
MGLTTTLVHIAIQADTRQTTSINMDLTTNIGLVSGV